MFRLSVHIHILYAYTMHKRMALEAIVFLCHSAQQHSWDWAGSCLWVQLPTSVFVQSDLATYSYTFWTICMYCFSWLLIHECTSSHDMIKLQSIYTAADHYQGCHPCSYKYIYFIIALLRAGAEELGSLSSFRMCKFHTFRWPMKSHIYSKTTTSCRP